MGRIRDARSAQVTPTGGGWRVRPRPVAPRWRFPARGPRGRSPRRCSARGRRRARRRGSVLWPTRSRARTLRRGRGSRRGSPWPGPLSGRRWPRWLGRPRRPRRVGRSPCPPRRRPPRSPPPSWRRRSRRDGGVGRSSRPARRGSARSPSRRPKFPPGPVAKVCPFGGGGRRPASAGRPSRPSNAGRPTNPGPSPSSPSGRGGGRHRALPSGGGATTGEVGAEMRRNWPRRP